MYDAWYNSQHIISMVSAWLSFHESWYWNTVSRLDIEIVHVKGYKGFARLAYMYDWNPHGVLLIDSLLVFQEYEEMSSVIVIQTHTKLDWRFAPAIACCHSYRTRWDLVSATMVILLSRWGIYESRYIRHSLELVYTKQNIAELLTVWFTPGFFHQENSVFLSMRMELYNIKRSRMHRLAKYWITHVSLSINLNKNQPHVTPQNDFPAQ